MFFIAIQYQKQDMEVSHIITHCMFPQKSRYFMKNGIYIITTQWLIHDKTKKVSGRWHLDVLLIMFYYLV